VDTHHILGEFRRRHEVVALAEQNDLIESEQFGASTLDGYGKRQSHHYGRASIGTRSMLLERGGRHS
jgi:hypothetical protein